MCLPTSLLLARNRKATAAYVEDSWRSIGCEYFGTFVVSTAFRGADRNGNKFRVLDYGYLPENVNLLLRSGARDIPLRGGVPHHLFRGSDFYRDIHAVLNEQFDAMCVSTVVHYYAYSKVYRRHNLRDAEYYAYILSHIQQHLATGSPGGFVNSYSTLAISEAGRDSRTVYETKY